LIQEDQSEDSAEEDEPEMTSPSEEFLPEMTSSSSPEEERPIEKRSLLHKTLRLG
jgi:hypothetical protein